MNVLTEVQKKLFMKLIVSFRNIITFLLEILEQDNVLLLKEFFSTNNNSFSEAACILIFKMVEVC